MPTFTHQEFLKTEMPKGRLAVVKKFVDTSRLLAILPFTRSPGPADPVLRQAALPETTSRAIGETYAHTEGRYDPGMEFLKIQGGRSTFDAFQVATGQSGRRSQEAESFVEAIALNWDRDFFKADADTEPRDFDGLQARSLKNGQSFQADESGGTVKPLAIKRALDIKREVSRPTHWMMGELLVNWIIVMAHDRTVGGYITRDKNAMGEEVVNFCMLPIIPIMRDAADVDILDFNEAVTAGGNDGMSCYCVSLRVDRLHGIQNKPVDASDLGLDPSNGTQYNFVVEWYASIKEEHRRSFARYRDIADARPTLEVT